MTLLTVACGPTRLTPKSSATWSDNLDRAISVSMLPDLLGENALIGHSVVVIDVLRASTTIVHALSSGASAVIPCETVEEARSVAEKIPPQERVLGGERHSVRIEGFDLDNSPFSYTSEVVSGKRVIFTTTNGTFALRKCGDSDEILIGSFVNLSAIVERLLESDRPIHLMCAGTNRQLTAEDLLFAGAVIDRLLKQDSANFACATVQAQMVVDFYRARAVDCTTFEQTMMESLGGRNLLKLGLKKDIQRAMEIDRFDFAPVWNPESNLIE